jgi:glycine/D-amino acid oxidase-like deaminating enzyme
MMTRSLWLTDPPATTYRPLAGQVVVDAAVLGGGIAGVTTALLLKRAGLKVVLLEAAEIASGVTGHTTAKVTSQHRLRYAALARHFGEEGARAYAEANEAGLELIVARSASGRLGSPAPKNSTNLPTTPRSRSI